jgi:hydroxyacylglutathione hydrolase
MRITPWLYLVGSRQFGLSSPYDCHIYALRAGEGILLVDSGSGLGQRQVLENLREEFGGDLGRGTILITHKHPDHSCGAAGLARELGWPVVASIHSAPVLEAGNNKACGLTDAQAQGGYPPELRLPACPVARTFDDGDPLLLEGIAIRPIRVRGHSEDSFAFLFETAGNRCLLSADVVFYGGVIGLIHSADSSLPAYRADFGKLAGLGVDALLPGHGLFTLHGGQAHIDAAQGELKKGFVPRCVGQGDLIF